MEGKIKIEFENYLQASGVFSDLEEKKFRMIVEALVLDDLKKEIIDNNAYFEIYKDKFQKHKVTPHAHSNELINKMRYPAEQIQKAIN